jgi:molecular chaperone GrpE
VDEQQDFQEDGENRTGEQDEFSHSTSSEKISSEELVVLQQKLEEMKAKNDLLENELVEIRGQLARSLADMENVRRRTRKEKEEAVKYASVPLVESLLPVLDNFERALDAADGSKEAKVLLDGVEMVYRQLLQSLSDAGLNLVEAVGVPFDPHVHNAVMQVESVEQDSGIILEELLSGYRFRDRVIRPSMVKVSV